MGKSAALKMRIVCAPLAFPRIRRQDGVYYYTVVLYVEIRVAPISRIAIEASPPTGNKWNAIGLFRCTFSTQLKLRRISQEILAVQTIETLPPLYCLMGTLACAPYLYSFYYLTIPECFPISEGALPCRVGAQNMVASGLNLRKQILEVLLPPSPSSPRQQGGVIMRRRAIYYGYCFLHLV